jgi:hypothetical protein
MQVTSYSEIGDPPVAVGAVQVRFTCPLPVRVATTFDGALGFPMTVTGVDCEM